MARQSATRAVPDWWERPIRLHPGNLGFNYGRQNNSMTWLDAGYDGPQLDAELDALAGIGVRKSRLWAQVDQLYSWNGTTFTANSGRVANLHDALDKFAAHDIAVILVLGDANVPTGPVADLSGLVKWPLVRTSDGRAAYATAWAALVTELLSHEDNVLMWEFANEPYESYTLTYPASIGVTLAETFAWLQAGYAAVKPLTSKPVGVSNGWLIDPGGTHVFSNSTFRQTYVDPVTDVYSVHYYVNPVEQMEDYRALTGKPWWLTEVGAANYVDVDASTHETAGNFELLEETPNARVVRGMITKAINGGFDLAMPWSWTDNATIVTNNGDGSFTLHELPRWVERGLTPRSAIGQTRQGV